MLERDASAAVSCGPVAPPRAGAPARAIPAPVRSFAQRRLVPLTGIVALVALWHVAASSGAYTADQLPSPAATARAAVEAWRTGLLGHVGASLARFAGAYGAAVVLAVPLGLLLGLRRNLWRAVDPVVQVLRPISPIAWFPLAVLWLGIGNLPAIFIIFLAAFFPSLLATVGAVRRVDPQYLRVAQNFGSTESQLVRMVVIPAAFPQIALGLHIALGSAWVYLVAGEMLGARSGLGFLIVDARNFLRTDLILVGMAVIGLLGLAIDRSVAVLERRIQARWGVQDVAAP
jgi:NitT/TauT family transport system permease protein